LRILPILGWLTLYELLLIGVAVFLHRRGLVRDIGIFPLIGWFAGLYVGEVIAGAMAGAPSAGILAGGQIADILLTAVVSMLGLHLAAWILTHGQRAHPARTLLWMTLTVGFAFALAVRINCQVLDGDYFDGLVLISPLLGAWAAGIVLTSVRGVAISPAWRSGGV